VVAASSHNKGPEELGALTVQPPSCLLLTQQGTGGAWSLNSVDTQPHGLLQGRSAPAPQLCACGRGALQPGGGTACSEGWRRKERKHYTGTGATLHALVALLTCPRRLPCTPATLHLTALWCVGAPPPMAPDGMPAHGPHFLWIWFLGADSVSWFLF